MDAPLFPVCVGQHNPCQQKELKAGRQKIVQVDRNLNEITLHKPPNSDNPGPKKRTFTFDHVYDENALQKVAFVPHCSCTSVT